MKRPEQEPRAACAPRGVPTPWNVEAEIRFGARIVALHYVEDAPTHELGVGALSNHLDESAE